MATGLTDRVLVTGGTGLIGSWLAKLWPPSAPTLLSLGSSDVDLLRTGAAREMLEVERPTALVHLAWSASGNPSYRTSEDNQRWVQASLELAGAAARLGIRCWFTGTVVDEGDDEQASSVDRYAMSKARLRAELAPVVAAGGMGWFRPMYVIDPERGRPALVAQAVSAATGSEPVVLRTPHVRHDFVHAGDVAEAMARAVSSGRTGLLEIGSGRSRPVSDLVAALGAAWVAPSAVGETVVRHSGAVADIGWLSELGWSASRTDALFAVDTSRGGPHD